MSNIKIQWNIEKIKKWINDNASDFQVLSNDYNRKEKLKFLCPNGHMFKTLWYNFYRGECRCKICQYDNKKIKFEYVKFFIESENYTLLSEEYVNSKDYLNVRCSHGHEYKTSWNNFKRGYRCIKCANGGENNGSYKGGVTPLQNHLRTHILEWKIDSCKNYNYKCILTGKSQKKCVVHHVNKNFKDILIETLKVLNLPLLSSVNKYTEEELERIRIKCLELHYEYGLGILIHMKLHKLFHMIYGKVNNTIEQFEEFKTRLKSGEFSDFLEENKLSLII